MNNYIYFIILALTCYLFGNVNWALIISKIKKNDIRKLGSGNPGTLNMTRVFGAKLGIITLILDVLKGSYVVVITYFLFKDKYLLTDFALVLAGFSVVMGHIFPVFMKFKGGKGVAPSIGVLIACSVFFGNLYSIVLAISIIVALIYVYFTEIGAIGSFIAILPTFSFIIIRFSICLFDSLEKDELFYSLASIIMIVLLCVVMLIAHRKNFIRIKNGTENPTSIKKMFKKNK